MLLSERKLGDRKLGERKVGDWLSIFCVRMARKKRQAGIDKGLDTIACLFFLGRSKNKETRWDKVGKTQGER